MTDFRALCAELVDALQYHREQTRPIKRTTEILTRARAALAQPEPQGPTDAELHQLWQNLYAFHDGPTSGDVAEISRTALQRWGNLATKPDGPAVPHGREPASVTHQPTDKELHRLMHSFVLGGESPEDFSFDHCGFARAALARWGRPAIEPVPVGERLPGPEDCDTEGRCWLLTVEDDYPQWRLHSIQGAQPGGYMIWVPVDSDGSMVDCFYTSHWLPAHALPVPQ